MTSSTSAHKQLDSQASEASRLLKALSNETRIRLLCLLMDGEKSAGELAKTVGMKLPAISQHLAKMRSKDLVSSRRDGQTIYYQAKEGIGPAIVSTLCEWYKTSETG